MSWTNFGQKAGETAIGWAVVGMLGGIAWLVRRVFTNQKQIEMLSKEVKSRDEMRQRDREDVTAMRQDFRELRKDVMKLAQK